VLSLQPTSNYSPLPSALRPLIYSALSKVILSDKRQRIRFSSAATVVEAAATPVFSLFLPRCISQMNCHPTDCEVSARFASAAFSRLLNYLIIAFYTRRVFLLLRAERIEKESESFSLLATLLCSCYNEASRVAAFDLCIFELLVFLIPLVL
jgi:hypothetical protein